MAEDPLIRKLRQRLERWELQHMRDHARQQHDRMEELQDELAALRVSVNNAQAMADYWHGQCAEMMAALSDDIVVCMDTDANLSAEQRPLTKHTKHAKPVVKQAAGTKGAQ